MSQEGILVGIGLLLGVLLFGALPTVLLRGAPPRRVGLAFAFGAGTLLGPLLTAVPSAYGRASGQVAAWLGTAGIPDAARDAAFLGVQTAALAALIAAYGLGWTSLRSRIEEAGPARGGAAFVAAALALRGIADAAGSGARTPIGPTAIVEPAGLLLAGGFAAVGAFAFAPLLVRAAWPAAVAIAAGVVAFAPPLLLAFAAGPRPPGVLLVVAAALLNVFALSQLVHFAQANVGGGLRTSAAVGAGAVLTWRDLPALLSVLLG